MVAEKAGRAQLSGNRAHTLVPTAIIKFDMHITILACQKSRRSHCPPNTIGLWVPFPSVMFSHLQLSN